jgi:hypothetical protein
MLGYRDRGGRCEGIYIKEVGSTALLVASFTESFENYQVQSGQPLQVEWDNPPDAGPVRLRAQSLRRRLYYRMDSEQPAGSASFRWPSDVLASLNILKNDVGLVGTTRMTLGQTTRDVLVPLRIRQQSAPVRTGRYRLVLLPGAELQEVFISLAKPGPNGLPKVFIKDGVKLGYGFYPAERGIEIPIEGLTEAGAYYLSIGAAFRNGEASTVEVWFYQAKP